jgi:hypothetical protein
MPTMAPMPKPLKGARRSMKKSFRGSGNEPGRNRKHATLAGPVSSFNYIFHVITVCFWNKALRHTHHSGKEKGPGVNRALGSLEAAAP